MSGVCSLTSHAAYASTKQTNKQAKKQKNKTTTQKNTKNNNTRLNREGTLFYLTGEDAGRVSGQLDENVGFL